MQRRIIPQKQNLFAIPELQANLKRDKKSGPVSKVLQGTLAVTGLGAAALYLDPAQRCADIQVCGKWFSDLTSRNLSVAALTAGGLDFAAGNAFMGPDSIDKYLQFVSKQPTLPSKIGMGSFVFVFAGSQIIPLSLVSLRTSSALWKTMLTLGGAAPGSVYGAIHIIEDVAPYYFDQLKTAEKYLRYGIASMCSPLMGMEDKIARFKREEFYHYQKQHALFINTLNEKWRSIVENARGLDIKNYSDIISFLDKNPITRSENCFSKTIHNAGIIIGLALAANFTAGGIKNTLDSLNNYIPYLPLQIFATSMFSISTIFANTTLTISGVTSILDTLADILQGKQPHSLLFQLSPKATLSAVAISLLLSPLSYAVIAILFINSFMQDPNNTNTLIRDLLFAAMAGINTYHYSSMMHLYHLMFKRFTSSEKNQILLELEHMIEVFKFMPMDKWLDMVKQDPDKYNVEIFPEQNDIEAPVEIIAEQPVEIAPEAKEIPNETTPLIQINKPASASKAGWTSWFCCMFSPSAESMRAEGAKMEVQNDSYISLPGVV